MAVAFDAVGPSSSGQVSTTTSISWTHTPAGTPTSVLVYFMVGLAGPGVSLSTFSGVTYGSASLSLLSTQESGGTGTGYGGIFCFGTSSPPSGAQTVSATYGSSSGLQQIIGISVSATGSTGFGTPVPAYSASSASGSLAVTGTTAGGLCVIGICDGSGGESLTGPAGVAQQWKNDYNGTSTSGNVIGGTVASPGGTATFAWSQTSDAYGAIGVEVRAPSSTPGPPLDDAPVPVNIPVIVTGRAGWRNAGHSR